MIETAGTTAGTEWHSEFLTLLDTAGLGTAEEWQEEARRTRRGMKKAAH